MNDAQWRFDTLKLAERLGNITEACRISGMDRTSFYKWKQRYEIHGLDGLIDRSPIRHSSPRTSTCETASLVVKIALDNPKLGCGKIAEKISNSGNIISSFTVHKILSQHQISRTDQRLLRLEEKFAANENSIQQGLIDLLEKNNPRFAYRKFSGNYPGQIIAQSSFFLRKGGDKINFCVAVDTYSSFLFIRSLYKDLDKRHAIHRYLIDRCVVPFFKKINVDEMGIYNSDYEITNTSNGEGKSLYMKYLRSNKLRRIRSYEIKQEYPNNRHGFVEYLVRELKEGMSYEGLFERINMRDDEGISSLKDWVYSYNYERRQSGYKNFGKTPWERIRSFD